MKRYTRTSDLVFDLHQKGFTHDFQLKGNDLFWLNYDKEINIGEFIMVEFHKIIGSHSCFNSHLVLGIFALHYNIKGIFLRRFKGHTIDLPPVIVKKLNELEIKGVSWKITTGYSCQREFSG